MTLLTEAESQLNAKALPSLPELLGIEPAASSSLIAESLPALLSIFQNAAGDPAKATLIDQFLSEIGPDLLENPDELLVAQGKDLMKAGKGALAKLLGPKLTDSIAPIAQATGLGEGKVASGLGTLAPFVMSLLSRKAGNAEELGELFAEKPVEVLEPVAKVPAGDAIPAKSYLPDPNKKKERRPFPIRKAVFILIIIALLAAAAYFILDMFGILNPPIENMPRTSPTPAVTSQAYELGPDWQIAA